MTYLEPGAGDALGAALGALLLNELPPTRPPERAASASPGTVADSSNDAASAALASLATWKVSSSCFFWLHTVTAHAVFRHPPRGELAAGLLTFSEVLPNTERWSMHVAIACALTTPLKSMLLNKVGVLDFVHSLCGNGPVSLG